MTDPVNTNPPAGVGTNPPADPNNPPKQPENQPAPFDTAKISDADFAKVFDDPRTFQHSRFKELTEAQKKLKEIEANKTAEEEKQLKEQNKWKELAEKKEQEADKLKESVKTANINNKLLAQASTQGAVDPDAVLALVDRSELKIDEQGNVTGAEEAVKKLLEAKPYLAGKTTGTKRLGTGSNPADPDTGNLKRFKRSQLQNPVFYRENEKDILASYKAGLIEDDM